MLGSRSEGAQVLDLFAGTGSLGLEALSRGASFCLFVEQDAGILERNIEAMGFQDVARVHRGDVFRFLTALRMQDDPIDIVFVDPPHRYWQTKGSLLIRLLKSLVDSEAVRDEAVWVLGHPKGSPASDEISFLGPLDRRSYGEAHITIASL